MAAAAVPLLDGHLKTGILSVPLGSCQNLMEQLQKKNIEVIEGAKDNLPDEQSIVAAIKIKALVSGLGSNDILLVLVSGNISMLLLQCAGFLIKIVCTFRRRFSAATDAKRRYNAAGKARGHQTFVTFWCINR
jgi:hypothetical protein